MSLHDKCRFLSLSSMGRVREEADLKSQLVTEICNISRRASACVHWHAGGGNTTRSPLIDWSLVLRVEGNAGLDVTRKQRRKLALQLHPDKNKHPKAEVAFMLVSEGYACLSETAERAAFNLHQQNNYCIACKKPQFATCNDRTSHAAKTRDMFPTERLRSQKLMQGLKDLRTRFTEEIMVIESCLRTKATTTSMKESPIFDPV